MSRGEFYLQHQPVFVLVVILAITLSVGGLILGGALGSFAGASLGAFIYLTGPWLILSHRDPPPSRRSPRP